MPRAKGPRLYLRKERRSKSGRIVERAKYVIRDGGKYISTGCFAGETAEAEKKLAEYIAGKYEPPRSERDIEEILISEVLAIFHEDTREDRANPKEFDGLISRLNDYWGNRYLSEVNARSCREFAEYRKNGAARNHLANLRAAINYHNQQGLHRGAVRVTLPPKGLPRERWLTRSEAARLIWACLRHRER